jgi:hypothetical protein
MTRRVGYAPELDRPFLILARTSGHHTIKPIKAMPNRLIHGIDLGSEQPRCSQFDHLCWPGDT